MKTRVFTVCAVIFLFSGVVQADSIRLNFDSLTGMSFRGTGQYVPELSKLYSVPEYGIHFSSDTNYVAVVNLGVGHATSGTNGVGGVDSSGKLNYGIITMKFFDPETGNPATTDYVSLRLDQWGGGPSQVMQAFGVDGKLIEEVISNDIGGTQLKIASSGIHSVIAPGDFDDLEFNTIQPASPCFSKAVVTFTAGTPAKAADVNANFDAHNCQIQALKAIVCQDHPTASICQ
ncbi:MAG: hypothetical protein WCR46_15680 [Deltaproteobacteria bacterium]